MQHQTKSARALSGDIEMRLVDRSEVCPLCGGEYGCASACVSNEWPPRMDRGLLRTRVLIAVAIAALFYGMCVTEALARSEAPPMVWLLAGVLSVALAGGVVALLMWAEDSEAAGTVTSRGRRS